MAARTVAIGDIHGCSRALDRLLGAVAPSVGDVIVTLGDYVNRGPDSHGVIERLIALEGQCTLIPILGNHDQMLLEAEESRDQPRSPIHDMISDADLAFLRRCRSYHETQSHIFVHANYDPGLAMELQSEWVLRWRSLSDGAPGPHQSGKTVIAGHTSQQDGRILDLGYLICIDTYCYGGGWLTALDVDSRHVWQANEQGELRAFMLEAASPGVS